MAEGSISEFISLREYLDKQFSAHDKLHAAESLALDVARKNMERRLDDMNELRKQIEKERALYIQRPDYDKKHEDLEKSNIEQHNAIRDQTAVLCANLDVKIQALEKFQNKLIGGLVVFQVLIVFVLHYWK